MSPSDLSGRDDPPINLDDYATRARAILPAEQFDYFAGGSEDEVTLRGNRAAFEQIWLRPRVLVDVSACDTTTTVLGLPLRFPVMVAPMSVHGMAHPVAEAGTAAAARDAGSLIVASTLSNLPLEAIASAADRRCWFQLYIYTDRGATERLVRRAEAAGYRALVLTVDTPLLGTRERDLRHRFQLPAHLRFGNFLDEASGGQLGGPRAPLTWSDLAWLRALTTLPIVLKGILTAEDARLAVEHGAAGIVVSNHGGRQLDGALPSIRALPAIADAVARRCEIYLDGGVRRGTDVLKAVALGARAVLVGRPLLWGLAVTGEAGARDVLRLLEGELRLAMRLAGLPYIAAIDRAAVVVDHTWAET